VSPTLVDVIAVAALVVLLTVAFVHPPGWVEAPVGVLGAVAVVGTGAVTWHGAVEQLRLLFPVVAFLAGILVVAEICAVEGVFTAVGTRVARASRREPRRMLQLTFLAAAATTAVLSLDATVVLLTPVVMTAAARSKPHVYACAHLANSASLLLPVSNLTNLLAFAASGLTFTGFAALMALPWLAVIAVEYLVFRWFFAADLAAPIAGPAPASQRPTFALVVLALTLAGFAVAQPLGVHPAFVAAAGALVLAVRRRVPPLTLLREANPYFCAFVFALGVVVLAVRQQGLDGIVRALVPQHATFLGLLAVAGLAALLANLLNNLPAVLILVPTVSSSPGLLLAALIGVNVGPNLTYVGSLATLLWRQVLHARDAAPAAGEFLRLGAVTVPLSLVAGVGALWVGLHI
jgi:arsenical pump membrane protein